MRSKSNFDCSIPENIPRHCADGVVCLEVATYTLLDYVESEQWKEKDEQPISTLLIEYKFLCEWINEHTPFNSLYDFYSEYTYDTVGVLLRTMAYASGSLALEFRPSMDRKFVFNNKASVKSYNILIAFITGLLQENGHEEASKYLDCLMEF